MATEWYETLESTVYSIVSQKVMDKLDEKYPNLNFTSEEAVITEAKFPNVYLRASSMTETGNDLTNAEVNAVSLTMQADVITNTSRADAKAVVFAVISALKELRFNVTQMPIFTKEDDINRAVIRGQRIVGGGDTFTI